MAGFAGVPRPQPGHGASSCRRLLICSAVIGGAVSFFAVTVRHAAQVTRSRSLSHGSSGESPPHTAGQPVIDQGRLLVAALLLAECIVQSSPALGAEVSGAEGRDGCGGLGA